MGDVTQNGASTERRSPVKDFPSFARDRTRRRTSKAQSAVRDDDASDAALENTVLSRSVNTVKIHVFGFNARQRDCHA